MAVAAVGTAEEDLVDGDIAPAECSGGTSHVQEPDAVGELGDVLEERVGVASQALHPTVQSEVVVFAEIFNIAHLQALGFGGFKNLGERDQMPVGKNVSVNKGILRAESCGGARDAVIEKDAAGPQQAVHGPEVLAEVLQSNVLKHADAGDLVEIVLYSL